MFGHYSLEHPDSVGEFFRYLLGEVECISNSSLRRTLVSAFFVLLIGTSTTALGQLKSPKDYFGFEPATSRKMVNWDGTWAYYAHLDQFSERVKVRSIGKSTLGRDQIVAFISSEENIRNLDEIQRTNRLIAEGKTKTKDGVSVPKGAKAIVAVSCSIHATEVVGTQMSLKLAYKLASANGDYIKNILENTVLVLIPSANPDGNDIVYDWYQKTLGTKYEGTSPPTLYHHYAGHDNNRDWFMMNLVETRNITKLFWKEWFPQIVFDVHQQGAVGARMTIPPFFDPPNPRIPPLLLREIGLVGYKIAADLAIAGEKGIATNATYDTWWHGGFRSAPYYHNSIGILSEAASARLMTPVTITKEQLKNRRPTRGLRNPLETATNFPVAWEGGEWRPEDIARINMKAILSVLDLAGRYRTRYLENFGRLASDNLIRSNDDPRGFVVLAGQPHGERVSRFLEILMWQGIEVYRMRSEFEAKKENNGRFEEIPGGSFYIPVNQIQKNNVLSLFEKQVYPNRVNAAGEAEIPYDVSGWTLPLQMGVEYESVWEIEKEESISLEPMNSINDVRKQLNLKPVDAPFSKLPNPIKDGVRVGIYRGRVQSMDEGWTRLVFDNHSIPYKSVSDADITGGNIGVDALILPSMSESRIVRGHNENRYPKELTGGIGEDGVKNLEKFVSDGGKLICFDDSCEMLIKRFKLPMRNALRSLNRKQFHSPGTILKLDVDVEHPYAKGFDKMTPAYFIYSSAYSVDDNSKVRSVAKYGDKDILLSGWIFGEKYLNGKTAIAESDHGQGKLILFGFRPQHRGQTYGTFPFIFNAINN